MKEIIKDILGVLLRHFNRKKSDDCNKFSNKSSLGNGGAHL